MKKLMISTASVVLASLNGGAFAAGSQTACVRGDFTRSVEVVAPGADGLACEVIYRKPNEGAPETRPWQAKFDAKFCEDKAKNLAATLTNAGWQCAVVAAAPVSASPAQVAAPVVDAQKAPDPQLAAAAAEAVEPAAAAPASQAAPQPAEAPREAAVQDIVEDLTAYLGEEDAAATPSAQPKKTVVEPSPAAAQPKQAEAPAPVDPAPAAKPVAPAAETPTLRLSAGDAAPAGDEWSDEDAIRAALRAKQAAWNEGDIEGFMQGYWNNRELRYATGSTVVKGWNATRKHYRARHANPQQMGDLSFSDIDVNLLTERSAIVFGKWNLDDDGGARRGVFTMVFEKIDGAWRIVHDHTSAGGEGW